MKKIGFLLAILALTLTMAGPVLAQGKAQTTCPVMGGNINKNIYADYKGQRVYFCCTGCDEAFKKNPEQYLEKLKSQGVTPEKAPAAAGKKAN